MPWALQSVFNVSWRTHCVRCTALENTASEALKSASRTHEGSLRFSPSSHSLSNTRGLAQRP